MHSLTRKPNLRLFVLAAAFSMTMALPALADDPLKAGLVGWWRFDEASGTTAADSSGTGNAGTLVGGATRVAGKVGSAASFTSGQGVTGSNAGTSFPIGGAPRTIAAWVKTPAGVTSGVIVFGFGTTPGPNESRSYLQVATNGSVAMSIGGTGWEVDGITRVDDGAWHHLAATYEGPATNMVRVYVDGQLDEYSVVNQVPNTGTGSNWRIGEDLAGTSQFTGSIDEVRLYNRALSAAEIQSIVTGDGGTIGPVPIEFQQTMSYKDCNTTPGGFTDLAYGQVANCAFTTLGEIDAYRFTARAGDRVWMLVGRGVWGDSGYDQLYRITDPEGVVSNWTSVHCDGNWNYCDWHLYYDNTLTKSGSYKVEVTDGNADHTYPYFIALKRVIPLPANAVQVQYWKPIDAARHDALDWHYYALNGTAGDKLGLTLRRLSGSDSSYDHQMQLLDPTGREVFYAGTHCDGNWNYCDATLSQDVTLDKTGQYILRITDGNDDRAFSYHLLVNCSGVCDNTPLPPPPQACDYFLSPPSMLLGPAAAGAILGISAPMGCPWNLASSQGWLKITTSTGGGGTDTIGFTVDQNTAAAYRTATVSIAGLMSTITQLGTSPMLTVTPGALTYNLNSGSTTKSDNLLSIYTNVASLSYTASVTMTDAPGLNWLKIGQTSGTAPGSLAVTADPTPLPPGTFTGSVTIKSPTASPSSISIPVTVKVQTGGAAQLSVAADLVTFSLVSGGQNGLVQRAVTNAGSAWLPYSAAVETPSAARWLTVSPSGGSVRLDTPDTLSIVASPSSLAAGTYSSAVIVTGGGKTFRIPVTMTLGTGTAKILLSQTGLTFTGVAGGGTPSAQAFGILNEGVGALNWKATATTLSGGNWLAIDSTSGTVAQPLMDVSLLNVSVNTSRLDPGDYYGKIEITGDAQNTPQAVTVLVSVLPRGSNPGPEVRPTGLIFVGGPNQKPAAQAVNVTNVISQPVAFTSTQLTFDGSKWLNQTPATATVVPNSPGKLSVQSDNSGLAAGVRRGVVTMLFDDGRSQNVSVLNVVTPQASPGASARAEGGPVSAASCQSPNLRVQFVALRDNFQVAIGEPATVQVKIVDECGNPLVPDANASTPVSASFSNGDADIRLAHEGGGQWAATWRPTSLPQGTSSTTVTVRAAYVRLGSQQTMQTGSAQLTGTLRSSSAPIVPAGAVFHAASFAPSAPVAPGGLITIFGANLSDQVSIAPSYPLPSAMGGTEVDLGGIALPLLYSSAGQVNAQVPFNLTGNTQYQVVVRRGDALSVPESFTVAAAVPGIFTTNMQGTGQGIIMRSDQLTIAQAATPAARGEVIVIYCAGLGAVNPPVKQGEAPTTASRTVNEATVTVGGLNAPVFYSGVTPGFPGLYQVNATLPDTVAVGNAVPVTITVAGLTSNTVTMAIK